MTAALTPTPIRILEHPAPTPDEQGATSAAADPTPDSGVLALPNDANVLDAALHGITRVELHFPTFTDGRAYSQAYLLRRRLGFAGDIRATGDVLIDQIQQMQRSGFSSAVLAPGLKAADAQRQLERFASFYQADAHQPLPHFARSAEPAPPTA